MKKPLLTAIAFACLVSPVQAANVSNPPPIKPDETAAAPEATAATTTTPMATIKFSKPHAFATSAAQKNGAVFFTLTNNLGEADRLLSVTSNVAEKTELHTQTLENDVMQMREAKDGFVIEPEQTLALEPTGNHIMLIGLKSPLVPGTTFTVTLDFEKTPDLTLPVEVIAPGTVPVDAAAELNEELKEELKANEAAQETTPETVPAADPHAGHDMGHGAVHDHDQGTAAE